MVSYFKEINNQLFSTEGGQNGKHLFYMYQEMSVRKANRHTTEVTTDENSFLKGAVPHLWLGNIHDRISDLSSQDS